jgi:hypothetical protein
MPDSKSPEKHEGQPKSLEMRVAELEDKLAKVHVTEEEMKAYHKVSSALGAKGGAGIPQVCVIAQCIIRPSCTIYHCIIYPCIQCINECGGGCIAGSGGATGGGFGTLGG